MNLWTDFRSGFRQILKQPWSSTLAIGALALSIGAISALFAVANALLLEPVRGIGAPERLVEAGRATSGGFDTISYPMLQELNKPSNTMEGLYGWTMLPVNLGAGGEPTRGLGFMVTENYFELLGVKAEEGRLFNPVDDAKRGASPHAVISHRAWQKLFGGAADVVGRDLVLNGQRFTVVGVADRSFGSHVALLAPDVYVPMTMQRQVQPSNGDLLDVVQASWLLAGGRLKPDVTLEQAAAEMDARFQAFTKANVTPDRRNFHFGVGALSALPADIAGQFGLFGGVMLLLVGLVMLVACVNVAGMLFARGEARAGELAVRNALGAGRGRLVRMLFVESLMMALVATAAGVLFAGLLLDSVDIASLPTPIPLDIEIGLAGKPLLWTVLSAVFATLVFGMWPALRSTRDGLAASGRGAVSHRQRAREVLVIAQIALTLVLLVASALFLRALDRANSIDLGFRVDGVYTADLDLEPTGYDSERQQQVAAQMAETLAATPGIDQVAYARLLPLSGSTMVFGAIGEEGKLPEDVRYAASNVVSDDYFGVLGIRVDGAVFGPAHQRKGEPVVIVNQILAEALFGRESAIGRVIDYEGVEGGKARIIGVAATSRYASLSEDPTPFLYLPARQHEFAQYSLVLQSALAQNEIERAVHATFARIDRNLPRPSTHAMQDAVALNLMPQRAVSTVAGALGALGLLLAVIGTYGLIAYFVASRTREIGVRLSMGATPRRIERDVLGRGLRLGLIGLGIGLVFSVMMALGLSGLVFGLQVGDGVAFAAAAAVLATAVLAASFFPARRAARISPMTALRYE